jgi:hypothetical protein
VGPPAVIPGQGYEIALPANWRRVSLVPAGTVSPADVAAFASGSHQDPARVRAALALLETVLPAGVSYVALPLDAMAAGTGFAPNLTVLRVPVTGATLDQFADAIVAQLVNGGTLLGAISRDPLVLPGGPALRLQYAVKIAGVTGDVQASQVLFQRADAIFVVTFEALGTSVDPGAFSQRLAADIAAITRSFQFTTSHA